MSYLRKRYGKRKRKSALGDIASSLSSLFGNVENAAGAALSFSQDPYLPEVACRFNQLASINANQTPGACTDTPPNLAGGVGLRNVIVPLRAYVYAQEHKWVYPVAVAAIIGIPLFVGYQLGSGKKSGGGS